MVTALVYFLFFNQCVIFNVSTLNLNAAKSDFKRAAVYKLMDIKHIDIMLVQEFHSCSKIKSEWRSAFSGEAILSHRSSLGGFYLLEGFNLSHLLLIKLFQVFYEKLKLF